MMPNGTALYGRPKLATIMEIQVWCAHPTLRHAGMILDPRDWDNIPIPLILQDVPVKKEEPTKAWLPWE